ncbi:class I SAM-dependent methyltransferase [Bacillus sp. DX4.1]|uniref:class I SAM-dependent methyltransferase n=1 Tax=Bacillus sp. DX4.1 TaxID=3055867 RepID=UPI0025A0D550|nr:class I SAM-dependent methyltransferase [Bacillus sp. DX4.1]MDM5190672.1 class I SAM-dependent methyltransferase [Bacillus sp. DX4.1]
MNQQQLSANNKEGWNKAAYEAWTSRHGTPHEYAQQLVKDPAHTVSHYLPYIKGIQGKRIINLLGSKGSKAVAFALLGADVTVVDISESNAKYAKELASAVGAPIEYIVSDVLDIQPTKTFDVVLLELGVLHYFIDLQPLFQLIFQLLKDGGTLILRDYHPIYTKLLEMDDTTFLANGNYFHEEIVEVEVAYSILLNETQKASLLKNKIRRWTLGEIITEIAQTNLRIKEFIEERGPHQRWVFPPSAPEGIENRIPGLYTLIATK